MNLENLILEIILFFFYKIHFHQLKSILRIFILLINSNSLLNISFILVVHFKTVFPIKLLIVRTS